MLSIPVSLFATHVTLGKSPVGNGADIAIIGLSSQFYEDIKKQWGAAEVWSGSDGAEYYRDTMWCVSEYVWNICRIRFKPVTYKDDYSANWIGSVLYIFEALHRYNNWD